MWKHGIRALASLGVLVALACLFAGSRASRADDDSSTNLIGTWRGTRRALGTTSVRHNLLSFMPGGVVIEAGPAVYQTTAPFGNGSFVETAFMGTWISEGHGNFVAHLIANIQEPPVSKGTSLGTENLTFRFHMETGKNGKELKGTLEGMYLDPEGKTLAQLPMGYTWDATPLTITSNGYN